MPPLCSLLLSLSLSLSLFLFLFFASASASSAPLRASNGKNFTWSLCSPEPPFQSGVFEVTLTPPQPVAGQTAVLLVEASTDAVPAEGASREDFGFAAVSVSFHGLPIYSLSRPLCDVIVGATDDADGETSNRSSSSSSSSRNNNNNNNNNDDDDNNDDAESSSCPFTGPYSLRWEQDFPVLTPAGRYHLRLKAQESQPGERGSRGGRRRSKGGLEAAGPEILCVDVAFNVERPTAAAAAAAASS